MCKKTALLDAILLAMIWFLLLPSAAQAYFDLGTGTYLVQLMLAFAATAWFSFRRVFVGKPKIAKAPETPEAREKVAEEKGEASA